MKTNLIVVFSILALTWLAPTTARTYRWTDENGVTIYSQSRPPSGEATIIKSPAPPPPASEQSDTVKKLKERLKTLNETKQKEKEAKDKEDKEASDAERKKQDCKNAKDHLQAIERRGRVKMKMKDGSYKMLTGEERAADIEKTKDAIKKYCE